MDSEGSTLANLLERTTNMVEEDHNLSVKAFGILLLGRRFENATDDENKDPTFAILGGKVGGLGSDEMIPRL